MTDTNEENFPEADNFPAEEQAVETAQSAAVETGNIQTEEQPAAVETGNIQTEEQPAETEEVSAEEQPDETEAVSVAEEGETAAQPVITEVDNPPGESKFESLVRPNPMPEGQVLLETRGLVKAYHGRKVVNDVNLTVKSGEIVGLLGPNGAGKTTSFYMVTGLIKPNEGSVFFKGVDVSHFPMYVRARMGMGYLAQEPSIFRKLSVEDNILAILQTLDISAAERRARLEDFLAKLELTHLRKQKAMTLSGGERRRLEITRALVTNPSFIMLDEPFSGVDPLVVYEIQQNIRQLRDMGLGILITDHNVRETLSCVDRAYLMADGKVCLEGTSDFLINSEEARKIYLGPAFVL